MIASNLRAGARLLSLAAAITLAGRPTADELRLEEVAVADLRRWEAVNGRLPAGATLLVLTNLSKRWPERAAHLGTQERGATAVPQLHIPGHRILAAANVPGFGNVAHLHRLPASGATVRALPMNIRGRQRQPAAYRRPSPALLTARLFTCLLPS
ncbi:hypothetical protein [Aurantiacibacter flavus]|uniref:Uncharacterized protein n=1 Tax=Aurantiacibacter flavus TaxID=3145232 RepID=A0ABV0D141_9SPHN